MPCKRGKGRPATPCASRRSIGVDDIRVNAGGGGQPNLTINDIAMTEGDAGTVNAQFTVALSVPAGPGGVTFDITTADNTATTADNDYAVSTLTGQTIAAGSSSYTFNVTVNGDATPETNETFFANVTNVTGATVADGQGIGTINNDDVTLTPIHDVQGPGANSPVTGSPVTVRGVVTGVRSNGFFIQEPDVTTDADPATSEGILVFTSSTPPAAVVVGTLVQVTGTVTEFVPSQDPLQPPLTELTSSTVVQISTGNPLPTPVPLTTAFPDPAGAHDQLERLEGMRVSIPSLTVTGPTLGSISESNATAASQGVFYGVVTGNPRPFREAGIQAPDPAPVGSIPPIPRFDSNPERIRVDSAGLGGLRTDVKTGDQVLNLIGPLDYAFRTYSILPDAGSFTVSDGGRTPVAVATPTGSEMTIASYNLERFFDTVNDPGIGEPVLTQAAFGDRLAKASLGIRDFLKAPDILGIIECENLTTLQALAAQISADANAASQSDPKYQAFLIEGNDVGGIDVGFLVKSAPVSGATPRVEVVAVTQVNAAELFVNLDSSTEPLNDRPPLVLEAIVHHSNGAAFPVTVIVVHQRSLNGVADPTPGSNGWVTNGDRVRAKRQKQAESLANLIQARQTADSNERIVVLGDFNAFEVNDGLVDVMAVVAGAPSPDNQTAASGDGVDLVNPDLDNLFDTPPAAERYSFVFDGNAQSLDHLLINAAVAANTVAHRIEHPRINADFPETTRNNGGTVLRLSDHDPVVGFFEIDAFATADLSITKSDDLDPVSAGTNLSYTVTVDNAGPDTATGVSWSDTLPGGTTFVSLSSPGGWSCTTPEVGAGGAVSCSVGSLSVGSAVFTLVVLVDAAVTDGTILSNTATVTATTGDPDDGDRNATATTAVSKVVTTTAITADDPDPSALNQPVTVAFTVTPSPLSAGAPTGAVTVSDGAGTTCSAALAALSGGAGSCALTFTTPGPKTLTASYAGDSRFAASISPAVPHGINATTFIGDSPTGADPITARITGEAGCAFTQAQLRPVADIPIPPPTGLAFPHGLFAFTATCPDEGSAVTVQITYPQLLAADAHYWKYGRIAPNSTPSWYQLPAAVLAGVTATFTIQDGGLGDDDLSPNRLIVDDGGPGVFASGFGRDGGVSIPTLSEWALLMFSLLLGGLVWRKRRRFG